MNIASGTRDPASLLDALAATPDRLDALIAAVDEHALDRAPAGEWPARTVLSHLRDDEWMVMRPRLARMLLEDHPALVPFDEQAWAASPWNARDPGPQLLRDFRLQREASLMALRRIRPDHWRRSGLQPEYGNFDIHWLVDNWLSHDELHLAQIQATLAAAGDPV
jgi:hypothetical protein